MCQVQRISWFHRCFPNLLDGWQSHPPSCESCGRQVRRYRTATDAFQTNEECLMRKVNHPSRSLVTRPTWRSMLIARQLSVQSALQL
jgi:hypothetical protein